MHGALDAKNQLASTKMRLLGGVVSFLAVVELELDLDEPMMVVADKHEHREGSSTSYGWTLMVMAVLVRWRQLQLRWLMEGCRPFRVATTTWKHAWGVWGWLEGSTRGEVLR